MCTSEVKKQPQSLQFKHTWNGIVGIKAIAASQGVSHATLHKYMNMSNGSIQGAIDLIQAKQELLRKGKAEKAAKVKKAKLAKKAIKRPCYKPCLGLWAIALGVCTEVSDARI